MEPSRRRAAMRLQLRGPSSESYSDKWQYVQQNPVRAGLAVRVEDWLYRGTINDLTF
jgi:hypothetical protein